MIELSLELEKAQLDFAEELCWLHGALSVSNTPLDQKPIVLKALISDENVSLKPELARTFPNSQIQITTVGELDWVEQVRAGFQPLRVGDISIVAEWDVIPSGEVIRVLPGQAFGTGQHETTQLALQIMQELDFNGKTVLDVGCGTGILAIASEKLGAISTLGIDNDPDCESNMLAHLELNQSRRVTLKIATLDACEATGFEIVIANITLNVLRLVWPIIWQKMNSGAFLVTTGILVEQEKEAVQVLQSLGFQIKQQKHQGDWTAILAQKE